MSESYIPDWRTYDANQIRVICNKIDKYEAEIVRLQKLIDDTATYWLLADLRIPWEGAIDQAMRAAVNEIIRLREINN